MSDLPNWQPTVDSLPDPCPDTILSRVAAKMREAALAPGLATMQAFTNQEHSQVSKDLLLALNAASIEAMLEHPFPPDPERRAWLLQYLVAAELDLRARVLAKVEALLDDREWVPESVPKAELEVRPPARRVCDQAYVSLRQLVHPEEDQVGYHVESDAFLHMPVEGKDRTIETARSSHTWNLRTPTPAELGY